MIRWVVALVLASGSAAAAPLAEVVQVSVGHAHVCAVTAKHAVVCWGDNAAGQLGIGRDGKTVSSSRPHVVGGLPAIQRVAAGAMHTCAIDTQGDVYCWGSAGGDLKESAGGTSGSIDLKGDGLGTPVKYPLGEGKARVIALAIKGNDACVAYADEVRCWSTFRAIPIGAKTVTAPTLRITKLAGVTALAIGHGTVCAVAAQKLACWRGKDAPTLAVTGLAPSSITIGEMYACVAAANGAVRCWHSLIDPFWKQAPSRIITWPGKPATSSIVAGDSPICSAGANGTVDCFLSDEGGLTDDAIAASWATTKLEAHPIGGLTDAVTVGLGLGRNVFGYGFGCALRKTGGVACWGDNESGQLGTGDTKPTKRAGTVIAP